MNNTLKTVKINKIDELNNDFHLRQRMGFEKYKKTVSFNEVIISDISNQKKIDILTGNKDACFFDCSNTVKTIQQIYSKAIDNCYKVASSAKVANFLASKTSSSDFYEMLNLTRDKTNEFFIKFLNSFIYRNEYQVLDAYFLGLKSNEFKKKYPRRSKV